ncbi:MAG: xylulokinase [Candidatus Omnitrophota bacterium]|jgi:xylulokinase|nr:MAG: xylulokinase [Candidatus Omnitrophota bacterium]
MAYLIGIDVGTSGTKTVLFDAEGQALAGVTEEYPLHTPHPGWTEQDPEDWWTATVNSISGVLTKSGVSPGEIRGIGLSGQMHGSVFLDDLNQVVRPAILWNDSRTADACIEITETIGEKRLLELASNPALTGFTAPKAVWLKKHEPENFQRTKKLLLPKDYVRYRLTGEIAMEVSDGAGTLLFNVAQRNWSNEILDALGIPREWMPPIYESTAVCGVITPDVANRTGLKPGTPVVGGGADNACGATGTGVVVEGRVLSSLGTSGVVLAPSKTCQTDPQGRVHTFCHSVPDRWYLMGVVLSAGMSLRWYRDVIADSERTQGEQAGTDPYDVLTALAEQAPIGSEGLLFLPYLTGERTPHKDPYARGGFIGLTIRHQRRHLVRAVLEGITFAMRDSLEIIRSLGVDIKEIRATGGGAKSAFWRQLQADIYGCEIAVIGSDQGPAFGAAIMAGVGTGVYKSIPEACDAIISVVQRTEPNAARVNEYNDYYNIYRSTYPALRETCHALSKKVAV